MAEGPEVVDLTVQLITARSGTTFGRGFRLRAIGQKLYVQMSGRKVPLFLPFDSDPATVQARALELSAFVQEHGSAFSAESWRDACPSERARTGKPRKPRLRLNEVIARFERIKLAEGVSQRTFEKHYLPKLKQLDPSNPLGEESLLRVIEATEPLTGVRRRTIGMLRRVCAICGAHWNQPLMESLQSRGSLRPRRAQPFFSDEQIEALLLPADRFAPSWRRVLALMAIYGLRPWEAWVAEPCKVRSDCVWIPVGKKATSGSTMPRQAPPFHPEWVGRFQLGELWAAPLPRIDGLSSAGKFTNRMIQSRRGLGPGSSSAYGFRHAYARRMHSDRYRVIDAHAALFMGHTVKTHYDAYRDWLGGDDPVATYLGSADAP